MDTRKTGIVYSYQANCYHSYQVNQMGMGQMVCSIFVDVQVVAIPLNEKISAQQFTLVAHLFEPH